jgi:hypothetical protein
LDRTGVRGLSPFPMLQSMCVESQRRFLTRKMNAEVFGGEVPPRVQKILDVRSELLRRGCPNVKVNFQDKKRTTAILHLGSRTRSVHCDPAEPKDWDCDCGGAELDGLPCACVLAVAEEAGVLWSSLLESHDTVESWQMQYENLPKFVIPGTEQLRFEQADESLRIPVENPSKRGRPSRRRIKGALERHKKTNK